MAKKQCSVDGCGGIYHSKGFCKKHYERFRKHGDPLRKRKTRPMCDVEGCDQPHYCKGFCAKHHWRFKTHGNPLVTTRKSVCEIEGCNRKHYGRGLCAMHHGRWKRHGDPLHLSRAARGEPERWLREQIEFATAGECIVWPFAKCTKGYGTVSSETARASRLALIIFTGDNPRDLVAAHGPCHNRLCVNPLHLSWKTPKGNAQDRDRDGTEIRGEQRHLAKLTEEMVLLIRKDKRPQRVIAKDFNVSPTTIHGIRSGATWKHI